MSRGSSELYPLFAVVLNQSVRVLHHLCSALILLSLLFPKDHLQEIEDDLIQNVDRCR